MQVTPPTLLIPRIRVPKAGLFVPCTPQQRENLREGLLNGAVRSLVSQLKSSFQTLKPRQVAKTQPGVYEIKLGKKTFHYDESQAGLTSLTSSEKPAAKLTWDAQTRTERLRYEKGDQETCIYSGQVMYDALNLFKSLQTQCKRLTRKT